MLRKRNLHSPRRQSLDDGRNLASVCAGAWLGRDQPLRRSFWPFKPDFGESNVIRISAVECAGPVHCYVQGMVAILL